MGGKSTSKGAVLSGKKTNQSSGFDLHSWQGLTEVLKRGKESLNDSAKYAEFRNLVLEYAQGGGDVDLKKEIDVIVATFANSSEKTLDDTGEKKPRKRKRKRRKKKKSIEESEQKPHTLNEVKKPGAAIVKERRSKPDFKNPTIAKPVAQKNDIEPPIQLPVDAEKVDGKNIPTQEQPAAVVKVTPEPVLPSEQMLNIKQNPTPISEDVVTVTRSDESRQQERRG